MTPGTDPDHDPDPGSDADAGSGFDPVAFLERAVRTPSHEDVSGMRSLLVDALAAHGVEARVDGAGNVLATRGTGAPHVALNTHVDTVTPHVPFERDGGVIRGRGACDAKGPLAAMVDAFLAVDPPGRLTLAVTPDEETHSTGAAALDLDADCYVVGEPTGLDVCTAAKGRFEGTVTLTGTNAHAAEPGAGANAVAALEGALRAVRTFDDADAAPPPHDDLGAPTLTPTVVAGGGATNQVPATCELTLDRRSVPPETAAGFRDALAARLRAAVPDRVGVSFDLTDRETPFLEAFETPTDHPLVRALSAAAGRATDGAGGGVRPFSAATEASYFAPVPTVVFGPGVLADEEGAVAHADREYVRVAEVRRAAAALREALASDALAGLDGYE
ncbi:MAG: M20 family metallopeptidase [Haloferacaceae archaeon]